MFFKNKNVLVTGGFGLVGSHLVQKLVEQGANVRATYHNKFYQTGLPVEYMNVDLGDMGECCYICHDQEYVFMCASNTAGAAVMDQMPLEFINSNVQMNSQMLEAAFISKVSKVLFLSSTTIYPDKDEGITYEDEAFIGDPYDKYYQVGWMKRYSEVLCRMFSEKLKRKMPCVVLRPSNIFGPHDKFDPERSHVLPALIRKVVERQNPLEVWGDGTEVRDFIYVDDMVDACLLAMEKVDTYYPMNIGMGKTYSVNELLGMICKSEKFNPEIVYNKSKPTMIPKRVISVQRAKDVLGWSAKVGLEEGLKKTINWYKASV